VADRNGGCLVDKLGWLTEMVGERPVVTIVTINQTTLDTRQIASDQR
jgi:hypothetical protein